MSENRSAILSLWITTKDNLLFILYGYKKDDSRWYKKFGLVLLPKISLTYCSDLIIGIFFCGHNWFFPATMAIFFQVTNFVTYKNCGHNFFPHVEDLLRFSSFAFDSKKICFIVKKWLFLSQKLAVCYY